MPKKPGAAPDGAPDTFRRIDDEPDLQAARRRTAEVHARSETAARAHLDAVEALAHAETAASEAAVTDQNPAIASRTVAAARVALREAESELQVARRAAALVDTATRKLVETHVAARLAQYLAAQQDALDRFVDALEGAAAANAELVAIEFEASQALGAYGVQLPAAHWPDFVAHKGQRCRLEHWRDYVTALGLRVRAVAASVSPWTQPASAVPAAPPRRTPGPTQIKVRMGPTGQPIWPERRETVPYPRGLRPGTMADAVARVAASASRMFTPIAAATRGGDKGEV